MNHLQVAEAITFLLENRFTFLKWRFGLDPLLNFIPWLGSFLGLLFSFYLIWIASQMRLPEDRIHQMIRNVFLDFFIGLVPFIGNIGDFFFKANTKNLKILKEYAEVKEAVVLSS